MTGCTRTREGAGGTRAGSSLDEIWAHDISETEVQTVSFLFILHTGGCQLYKLSLQFT